MVAVGIAVVAIAIVVVGEWTSDKQSADFTPQNGEEGMLPIESEAGHTQQQRKQQTPSTQKRQTLHKTGETSTQDTARAGVRDHQDEGLDREIENLQKKLKEVQKRVTQLRQEEGQKEKAREEQIGIMEKHAEQMVSLGNTLQRVFKTPRQIRIMVTDLESQAGTIRSQIQTQSRSIGLSSIERIIWTEKRTLLEQQAVELETISLDLQRSQGDPTKVRIVARKILSSSKELQTSIDNAKNKKSPPNNELLSLEKEQETINKKIQELQRKRKAEESKGK